MIRSSNLVSMLRSGRSSRMMDAAESAASRIEELERRIDFAVEELSDEYISDSAAEWVRVSVLAVLQGRITPEGDMIVPPLQSADARIAELEKALAAGDVVAHQLQYSQCPEVLENWWKLRGGHDLCTICSPVQSTGDT